MDWFQNQVCKYKYLPKAWKIKKGLVTKLAISKYNILFHNDLVGVKQLIITTNEGKICGETNNLVPIKSFEECNKTHEILKKIDPSFKVSTFVNASGNGSYLPSGCISDKVSGKHYVYWNPEGATISSDPKLKLICKGKQGKIST